MAKSNPNLTMLLQSMKKLSQEVNDHEICRRLEILINSDHEDLTPAVAKLIFEDPFSIEPKMIPEPFTQYVMHYVYMQKRELRKQESRQAATESKESKEKPSTAKKKKSK